jgi:hypothetical protein
LRAWIRGSLLLSDCAPSVSRRRLALGWPLHEKYERNHHQRGDAQQPEIVEVGDHVGFAKDCSVERPIGGMLRCHRSRSRKRLRRALNRRVELWIEGVGVSRERAVSTIVSRIRCRTPLWSSFFSVRARFPSLGSTAYVSIQLIGSYSESA